MGVYGTTHFIYYLLFLIIKYESSFIHKLTYLGVCLFFIELFWSNFYVTAENIDLLRNLKLLFRVPKTTASQFYLKRLNTKYPLENKPPISIATYCSSGLFWSFEFPITQKLFNSRSIPTTTKTIRNRNNNIHRISTIAINDLEYELKSDRELELESDVQLVLVLSTSCIIPGTNTSITIIIVILE